MPRVSRSSRRSLAGSSLTTACSGLRDDREPWISKTLAHNLERLVDAGVLFVDRDQHGENYTFKHALIQDAAYSSLLRSTRRQYHRSIAQALAERFSDRVETAPELLARHYTQAGMVAESVPCWLSAGDRALHASAHLEAIADLTTGLDLLAELPAGPTRAGVELEFRLALGPAYMALRGYAAPEVEACYQRARELCRELGDAPQLAPVLHGLWSYYIVRAQHASALALGEEVLELAAATSGDNVLLEVQGNMEVGWSLHFLGELENARLHLERVVELYDHERHGSHAFIYGDNLATSARGALALGLSLLGFPEQSLRQSYETIATLRSLTEHRYSVAFGLDVAATQRQWRGDAAETHALADEAYAFSEEHGLAFVRAMAAIIRGWVLTRQGQIGEGIAGMRRGLADQLATGADLNRPYWLCLIAEACGRTGDAGDALALLDSAEAAAERTDERIWEAEIHRLRGLSLLAAGDPAKPAAAHAAEACFRRALDVSRRQAARSLELRAAMALARLWQSQGRQRAAYDLLAPVYDWFTEGHDAPDLIEANELLAELDLADSHETHPTLHSGGT